MHGPRCRQVFSTIHAERCSRHRGHTCRTAAAACPPLAATAGAAIAWPSGADKFARSPGTTLAAVGGSGTEEEAAILPEVPGLDPLPAAAATGAKEDGSPPAAAAAVAAEPGLLFPDSQGGSIPLSAAPATAAADSAGVKGLLMLPPPPPPTMLAITSDVPTVAEPIEVPVPGRLALSTALRAGGSGGLGAGAGLKCSQMSRMSCLASAPRKGTQVVVHCCSMSEAVTGMAS